MYLQTYIQIINPLIHHISLFSKYNRVRKHERLKFEKTVVTEETQDPVREVACLGGELLTDRLC